MGFFSDLWDGITGSGAAKAAKQQTNLSKQAQDWQMQQWGQFGAPAAQLQLENMRRMQPFQNKAMGWLGGDTTGQPWWMQTGDVEPELIGSLNGLSRLNMDQVGQDTANNLSMFNASRGVNTSQDEARMLPAFQLEMLKARAGEKANSALTLDRMRQGRRAEAGGNFWNLWNTLNGQPAFGNPNSTVSPWAGTFSNLAGQAAGLAGQFGNQAGQSMGALGQLAGMWLGRK